MNIDLLTGNALSHNPRVIKEASSLAGAGYRVRVLGAWSDASLKARDLKLIAELPFSFVPVLDLVGEGVAARGRRLFRRVLGRGARLAQRWLDFESRIQLGAAASALGRVARLSPSDLSIAHSEPALFVARQLASSRERVAVDMEDWFSEDLLPDARKSRPLGLLRALERHLLCSASYSTCTSEAMSAALAGEYDCSPPEVIYNAFPWSDRSLLDAHELDRRDRSRPSIHWFSQTIGDGRGLEDLLAALPSVRANAEIHLRGVPVPGFEAWLAASIPDNWRGRIFVHPLVSNESLLSRIAEHDIGFAGETDQIRSRDLTVTNKILHYLLAGLVVVASETAGQREVARLSSGAVHLYSARKPGALASRLNALLESPELRAAGKAAALKAAERTFSWERQEPRLLEVVARALRRARD